MAIFVAKEIAIDNREDSGLLLESSDNNVRPHRLTSLNAYFVSPACLDNDIITLLFTSSPSPHLILFAFAMLAQLCTLRTILEFSEREEMKIGSSEGYCKCKFSPSSVE